MKTIKILTIGFLLLSFPAKSQYLPTTGQPFQFAPVYNPAFTGIDAFGDIKLQYRSQFGTYGANSPTFFNALYQFRLNEPYAANVNSFRTGSAHEESTTRATGIIHGMGINMFDEQLGAMSRRGGGISYAFHIPISEKFMLAVGTSAMVENLRIDPDKIYLGAGADPDPIYDQIMSGKTNNTQLNVRAGAVLYSQNFYVGVSYLPVWKFDLNDASWMTASSIYKATFQTGYNFVLSENLQLKPSVVGYLNEGNHVNFDYAAKIYIHDVVWTGLMYRDTQMGVAQLGFNINKMFSAAYSYELATGGDWKFGSGSHELVLGIRLNNFRNQTNYLW
ncbi:MAG: type IX secretion system membrane protein PorP/SprF [Bacteroidota bacterium]